MNNEPSSEIGLIQIHFRLKPEQIDFLKSIDPDNYSKALRTVIDNYRKRTKMMRFDKYLLYLIFFICIAVLIVLLYPIMRL